MEFNFNCYFVGLYILCAKMKTFSYVLRKVHCSITKEISSRRTRIIT